MIEQIATKRNEIELQVYAQHAVRGGSKCSDFCPATNDEGGFCCRTDKGNETYTAIYNAS